MSDRKITLEFSERELEVLREAVLVIDTDTLSDNLERDGLQLTSPSELNELGAKLERAIPRDSFAPR